MRPPNRRLTPDEERARIVMRSRKKLRKLSDLCGSNVQVPMVTRSRQDLLDYAANALAVILLGVLVLGMLYAPLVFDVYIGR